MAYRKIINVVAVNKQKHLVESRLYIRVFYCFLYHAFIMHCKLLCDLILRTVFNAIRIAFLTQYVSIVSCFENLPMLCVIYLGVFSSWSKTVCAAEASPEECSHILLSVELNCSIKRCSLKISAKYILLPSIVSNIQVCKVSNSCLYPSISFWSRYIFFLALNNL